MAFSKPPLKLQTTTLWDYPSQHYGAGMQGDSRYIGATPSYVIWNLLERYTRADDLIVDPFCGSGTTIDVARELGRKVRGFDLVPYRADIEQSDARQLPLESGSVDFVFMDPPYSDNVKYSEDPRCIGRINATDERYFEALDGAFGEAFRVLKDRRYFGMYICDYYSKKHGFVPIGLRCMELLSRRFKLIDHVCVVRHNKSLKLGNWHKAAAEDNFYLRGFNHLFIVKKELSTKAEAAPRPANPRRVKPSSKG